MKQAFGTSHRHHRERKDLHTLSSYLSAPLQMNEEPIPNHGESEEFMLDNGLSLGPLGSAHCRGFPIMESIQIIVVNSSTVNCFVEGRNGDDKDGGIGVETWRSISGRGTSGRQPMLPPGLGCFGFLAGTLFRALLAHHPTMLQSSHFYS